MQGREHAGWVGGAHQEVPEPPQLERADSMNAYQQIMCTTGVSLLLYFIFLKLMNLKLFTVSQMN